jgi:hypothetical protein
MSFPCSKSLMQRVCFLSSAAICTVVFASAQSSSLNPTTQFAPGESSSSSYQLLSDDDLSGAGALHDAAAALGSGGHSAAGQDNGSGHGIGSKLAFEAGGGFSAPIGNDTPYITWGGNFTGGAGLHFSRRFSLLGEFQFMDNKLPGALVAAGGGQTGNAHIISITAAPVIDLFPKSANSIYVTGGGGYYHKSTNFNIQECCDFYGYPVSVTANSFSSNQLGGNIGLGYSHRFGGVYGDGTMKLFAEARYVFIATPSITQTDGLGTTELIPVTMGVRW